MLAGRAYPFERDIMVRNFQPGHGRYLLFDIFGDLVGNIINLITFNANEMIMIVNGVVEMRASVQPFNFFDFSLFRQLV